MDIPIVAKQSAIFNFYVVQYTVEYKPKLVVYF
jgi:hypothetical protein